MTDQTPDSKKSVHRTRPTRDSAETSLDREIRADLEKETARKTRAVKIWNIVGLLVIALLAFLVLKVGYFKLVLWSVITLVIWILSSMGRRTWWK